MSTIDVPKPTTGPTARLALGDPSTQAAIGTVLAAAAAVVAPHVGIHASIPAEVQTAIVSVAGFFLSVVVGAKHFLAGSFAKRVATDASEAVKVAEVADPALASQVADAVTPLKAAVVDAVAPVGAAVATAPAAHIDVAALAAAIAAALEPVSNVGH